MRAMMIWLPMGPIICQAQLLLGSTACNLGDAELELDLCVQRVSPCLMLNMILTGLAGWLPSQKVLDWSQGMATLCQAWPLHG